MFFFLIVLPGLCLFSLVIGMIHFYRETQVDEEQHIRNGTDQMATDRREEASEAKKDIIYVSVCCASVLLFFTIFYFVGFTNFATEPIEHPDYDIEFIFFVGALTPVFMGFMFIVGLVIGIVMMSLPSFMRPHARYFICLIICILFILSATLLLG